MTTIANLELYIRARDEAQAILRQVKGELQGIGQESGKAAQSGIQLGGVLKGAFAFFGLQMGVHAVRQLAEMEVETLRLGAAAERMGNSFRTNFGPQAAGMLDALRQSSRGAISDTELMLNANRAMALGVASDAETMSQLLEIAAVKGRALGVSTSQAFDNIITGIGRMSPLILDNLGIMTGGEATFNAYAASVGKAASQLTDMEKRQALVNKVLAEGLPEVEKQKGNLDDNAAALERLGAAWANYRTAVGQAQGGAPFQAMSGMAEFLQARADFINAAPAINASVEQTRDGLRELGAQGRISANDLNYLMHALEKVQDLLAAEHPQEAQRVLDGVIQRYQQLGGFVNHTAHELRGLADAARDANAAMADTAAMTALELKWGSWTDKVAAAMKAMQAAANPEDWAKARDDYNTLMQESTDAQDAYNQSLMSEVELRDELRRRASLLPEKDPQRFQYLEQAAAIDKRLQQQGISDAESAAREREAIARESAEKLRSEIESILQPTQVTDIDVWKTSMGTYEDKWDEYIRRIRSGVEDAQSAWKDMVPADILGGGEEAKRGWLAQQEGMFYSGMLPGEINWEAFDRQLAEARERAAAREALIQEAMKRAGGGLERAEIVEALGLPATTADISQTLTGAFQGAMQTSEIGKPLADLFASQLDAQQKNFEQAGKKMMGWFLDGAETGITPETGKSFARKIWPYFKDFIPQEPRP